jgi:hypothetical protein
MKLRISLYYTSRRVTFAKNTHKVTQEIAQNNLKVFQEGQITELVTRAIDQLGDQVLR